jgi:type I site-specific restriction-modification system R (restriction) subunit
MNGWKEYKLGEHVFIDPDSLVIPAFHRTNKESRRLLSDRMKDPQDSLKLVIVRDMWLTGFDVPFYIRFILTS